jgi:hypothetical protein
MKASNCYDGGWMFFFSQHSLKTVGLPADYLRRGGYGRGNTRGAGVEVADVAGDVALRTII